MSRKLNALSLLFSSAVLAVTVSTVTAQAVRESALRQRSSAKAAVVAIKREDRLQLAGEKERLINAAQNALNSLKERGVVKDVRIRSFERGSYLAVLIEKRGTLFLPLEPSGGGVSGKYNLGNANYLYCASAGCTACELVMTGMNGPYCSCDPALNQGPTGGCEMKPVLYAHMFVAALNRELLAVGFEEADTGASEPGKSDKGAMPALEVSPGRPGSIKRP